MFARAGNDGGDDPYNFDIAGGFRGGGKKKNDGGKSKFAEKASLNKTVGARPSTSSLISQDSPTPGVNIATATVNSKEALRASAPAGPTSALDKAMSFLNKYKQGASGGAPAGAGNPKKPASVAKSFDEEEMDISLSSDSDAAARNTARKSTSRRTARGDDLVLKPTTRKMSATEGSFPSRSLTLTEMRSSAHFATAKELGISESEGLDGPKAAVSPLGFQSNRPTNKSWGGSLYQADVSSLEQQSSSLRLAVNIPGESSTYDTLVRHGSDSDVESVSSAMTEALEEQIEGEGETSEGNPWLGNRKSEPSSSSEVDAGGSSSLVSPTLEQQHGSASGGRFAPGPQDHSNALGKITSLDDLPTGSPPHISSIPGDREGSAVRDGGDSESSVEKSHEKYSLDGSIAEGDEEDEEEDDYGDDDFEDLDVLTESNGEKPGGPRVATEAPFATGAQGTKPATISKETAEVSLMDEKQSCVALEQPREAWSAPPSSQEKTRPTPATSESGTSPEPRVDWDNDLINGAAPENNQRQDGQAPSGTKEAWGETSARGSCTRGYGDTTSERTEGMRGDASHSFMQKCGHFQRRTSSTAACKPAIEGAIEGSMSKGGVFIDRSTEARDPIRPPDTKLKVVARAEAVASLEYTHDEERGLDLRSCGTQVMGNSAAVQANIVVPGMAGTHSSVDIDQETRSTHTAGVGYQRGEPYAKWGRFTCETPTNRDPPRRSPGRQSWKSPRPRPRPSDGFETVGTMEQKNDSAVGGSGRDSCGVASAGNGNNGGAERVGTSRLTYNPSVSGGSAYLETFLDVMAKAQAESCHTWQQVLETAPPPHVPASSDEQEPHFEHEPGLAHTAEDDTDPRLRNETRFEAKIGSEGLGEADKALHSILIATQDSFKRQLADMRENLNKIRYRAEVAGRRGFTHSYESVADVQDFLARARPPATTPAEAFMLVDPSLTLENAEALAGGDAEALAGGGTVPPPPVELHFCDRTATGSAKKSEFGSS